MVKRKVGLIVGYCGGLFHGAQIQPSQRTVESELLEALFARCGT